MCHLAGFFYPAWAFWRMFAFGDIRYCLPSGNIKELLMKANWNG